MGALDLGNVSKTVEETPKHLKPTRTKAAKTAPRRSKPAKKVEPKRDPKGPSKGTSYKRVFFDLEAGVVEWLRHRAFELDVPRTEFARALLAEAMDDAGVVERAVATVEAQGTRRERGAAGHKPTG